MAFPNVNWAKVKQDFDSALQANGNDATVLLNDGVTTFTIRTTTVKRRGEDLTDGLQQENDRLSLMADRWEAGAGAGRMPQKGDIFEINGRRQAVLEANTVARDDTLIGYTVELRG